MADNFDRAYDAGYDFARDGMLDCFELDNDAFVCGMLDGNSLRRDLVEKLGESIRSAFNKKYDHAAYWKVAEDVQMTRYHATNVTRLIAVRKGREGNDDVIFEIFINSKTKKATIKRDDTVLFTIGVDGLSAGWLQSAARSVLRSYLWQDDHSYKVSARIRSSCVAERKAAMENAASDEGSHE